MRHTAVVILNYNGKHFLERFLPKFIEHTDNAELIVIDNASTDDSVAWMKEKHPKVKIISLDQNFGFAGGYNEGLKQVKADYYAIVNSDIEVTEGWLSPLIDFLNSNPTYAACQPKIKAYDQKDYFEYAGAAGGYLDRLGFPYCRGRIFDSIEKDEGQYDTAKDTFWCTGACMLIRAETFWEAGGFDADFFAHMEEIDLCWRIQGLGRKVACIPASVVYHVGGGTLAKQNSRKTYLNFRNGLSLLLKNLPKRLLWLIPVRMLLDLLAGLKFWKDNDASHMLAILRAQKDFLLFLPKTLKKRKIIYQSAINAELCPATSIVWSYYIAGIRKFKQL